MITNLGDKLKLSVRLFYYIYIINVKLRFDLFYKIPVCGDNIRNFAISLLKTNVR